MIMTGHIFKGASSGGARDTNIAQGRGVRSKIKLGGLWLSGALFHKKKGHLQVNSFTVAIQRNCL